MSGKAGGNWPQKAQKAQGWRGGGEVEGRAVEGREPSRWEPARKTTVSSPGGVALLAGRQVPSTKALGRQLGLLRQGDVMRGLAEQSDPTLGEDA